MTDSQLDEIFKKQLPGHESPVPGDMWERIIQKKDRDRKGFFFFFSLIGLFILGFVTAGILLLNVSRKEVVKGKQAFTDSNAVLNSGIVQPVANDHVLEKDSSFNSVAYDKSGSSLQKPLLHGVHLKNKTSSKDRQTDIQRLQKGTKNNSRDTGQMEANIDAV